MSACLPPLYPSVKESLNNDGHQFHQYQQNEESRLILTEHKRKTMIYDIVNVLYVLTPFDIFLSKFFLLFL